MEVSIAAGADVNAATQHGMTALMSAAANGHQGLVSLLLERGADIHLKKTDGLNALSLAAFFGHVHVVRELIARGADIESKTWFGTSPAVWATVRGFHDLAEMLAEARTVPLPEPLNVRVGEDIDFASSGYVSTRTGVVCHVFA